MRIHDFPNIVNDLFHLQMPGSLSAKGASVLVVVPTRELASQITAVCRKLRPLFGIKTVFAYGGIEKALQVSHSHYDKL